MYCDAVRFASEAPVLTRVFTFHSNEETESVKERENSLNRTESNYR